MNMRKSILLVVLAFSKLGYAAPLLISPNKCPSIDSIKAIGFDLVEQVNDSMWAVAQLSNNYDTNVSWTFSMRFETKNPNAVIEQAKVELQSFSLFEGPTVQPNGRISCIYIDKNNFRNFAAAETPVVDRG